jgi:hypothetical protein
MLRRISWRWKAYVATVAAFITVVSLVVKHPISWFVPHLTLDPSSSHFRMHVFDWAFEQIAVYPLKGWGFGPVAADQDDFLAHASVDNVPIVCALRFGIPMILFLFLTNLGTFLRLGHDPKCGRMIYISITRAQRSHLASCASWESGYSPLLERDMDVLGGMPWHTSLD